MNFYSCLSQSKIRLYGLVWILLFVLYLPTWRAGFVSDTTGWLYDIQNSSFWDHINRSHFKVKSLYHFTQLVTWFFYQLFGTKHLLWHCLHISIHAANILLLFQIFSTLFKSKNPQKSVTALLWALLFYCISPSLGEVIVWEASFHYLLGMFMMLGIIRLIQIFYKTQNNKLLYWSVLIYWCSSFSIELFYITPLVVLSLIIWETATQMPSKGTQKKIFLGCFLPIVLILIAHFYIVNIAYGDWVPHNTSSLFDNIKWSEFLSKSFKIIGHVFLFIRYFPQEKREAFYNFCNNDTNAWLLFGFVAISVFFFLVYANHNKQLKSSFLLVLFWCVLCLGIVAPLWFPSAFWVANDRYCYFWMPFGFLIFSLFAQRLLPQFLFTFLMVAFTGFNLFALYKVNRKWQISAAHSHKLMQALPKNCNKKVILLNTPQCMNGIWMIPAFSESEANIIKSTLYPDKGNYPIKEVFSYNILSTQDGAHIRIINDSTIRVMLNQWGTWWWHNDYGATSYENDWYRADVDEYGFNVTIKGGKDDYLILFQNGNEWHMIDWNNKNQDQY